MYIFLLISYLQFDCLYKWMIYLLTIHVYCLYLPFQNNVCLHCLLDACNNNVIIFLAPYSCRVNQMVRNSKNMILIKIRTFFNEWSLLFHYTYLPKALFWLFTSGLEIWYNIYFVKEYYEIIVHQCTKLAVDLIDIVYRSTANFT
jgi:hypothetical protein